MSLIAVCHECDYETTAETEEDIHEQINSDGGKTKYLGKDKIKPNEVVKYIDVHCPNGHRIAGIVSEEDRDELPLKYWRKAMARKQGELPMPEPTGKADNASEQPTEMMRRYNAHEDLVELIEVLYEDRMDGGVDAGMTVDRLLRMANEIVEEHSLDV